ncbi:unnamed protein product [Echinostoma caproni]|uniref:BAR domain-containing protein n=1 Tax=Echinostoma caproni TaxID=27848 RepID=A0A183A2X0_9TREM|nr:unnamed protein product [Echinostoma caproni]
MPVDHVSQIFQSMTAELEQVIARYQSLFRTEEHFPSLFNKTEAFSHSYVRPLSSALGILKEAQTAHDNFRELDSRYFLPPLKKVADILPLISKLTAEREQIVKDLDKSSKKCMKLEGSERTGENLAKLAKVLIVIQFISS